MGVRMVVVGGGRMGEALLGGLLRARWAPADELAVVERSPARRAELAGLLPGVAITDVVPAAAAAVIAVKPAGAAAATADAVAAGARRVLSIAAGVTIATLEAAAEEAAGGSAVAVVRAMPNMPALIGQGASAIAGGRHADAAALGWAEGVLQAVGRVVRVDEPALDAVTGLSGSGPAYVFMLAEALVDAGVTVGLSRDVATQLSVQLLVGSAAMLAGEGSSAEALRAAVTSPGGTTAAGLRSLEAAGFRSAVIEAVVAATARSRELGS